MTAAAATTSTTAVPAFGATLTIRAAAQRVGLPERTFRRLFLASGRVRPIITGRHGRRIVIDELDRAVREYVSQHRAPLPSVASTP